MTPYWMQLICFRIFGENMFNTLAIALLFILLIWYVQYHSKRRRLYRMAAQRKGPFALPFIGSGWYFIGSPSDSLNKMLKLARKFDSPVPLWLGRQLYYLVWTSKDLEVIMKSPHALDRSYLYELMEIALGKGLLTAPASIWKRHKKIIMPTFNQKILDDYVEIFTQNSEILFKQLEKEVGKKTPDVSEAVGRCTFDIFCETAMGMKFNAQTEECDFFKWFKRGMELLAARIVVNLYLPDFLFRQTPLWKEGMGILEKFRSFTYAVVKEVRLAYEKQTKERNECSTTCFEKESHRKKIFVQQLIEMSEEGTKFTDEELQEEVNTFLTAGSHTSSIAVCLVFVILGIFPQIQDKLYEEVTEILGTDRRIECEDLSSFEYMERVIKETLRLFPAAPFLSRSVTGDIELENCTLPAGCSIIMSIIGLHRDSEVWPNPLDFNPDRFLPEEVAKRHPYSYLPFSGGFRSCPGSNFAMMSTKCIVATIVRKYRIFTDYRSIEDVKLMFGITLKPINGFKLSLTLR